MNLGLENVKRKLESARNEKIDRMLEWILLNKEVFQVQGSPTKTAANDSSSSGGGDDSSAPGDPSPVALETLSTGMVFNYTNSIPNTLELMHLIATKRHN